jgi:hypothetical protein
MVSTEFPYENFRYRLEYNETKEKRICWFECKEHLDKYISRHKLKKKDINVKTK